MLQAAAFRMLAGFYDNDQCGFVALCKRAGYPTDLGGDYVKKTERGQYHILAKGKQQLAIYYGKHCWHRSHALP